MKHWWLYVLKCEQAKYYVGITSKTPEERFIEHRDNIRAAAWTREFRPIALFDYRELGYISEERAHLAENRAVRKYIKKYGIENVRGGDISKTVDYKIKFGSFLEPFEYDAIKAVIFLMVIIIFMTILYLLK